MKLKQLVALTGLVVCCLTTSIQAQENPTNRQLVLQAFWWDYWNSNYPNGWANYLTEMAPRFREMGVDAIWIPPTIKNQAQNGVGYAPFDHYDLGDKFQKGFLKTRLGDKDELLRMMAVMKANGIDVIQDIVLNHLNGAGSANGSGGQDPAALDDGSTQRFKNFRYVSYLTPARNETAANYLARSGRFSKNWQNFYPNPGNPCCTNPINSVWWGPDVSYEANAFGLSSNAIYNPAQYSEYMRTEMRNWIIWNKKQMGWDGVRLDAVKHFPNYITEDYLWNLQFGSLWASGGNDMFAVGEWVGGASELDAWAAAVQNRAGTFDFALRNALTGIVSGNGNFNIGTVPNFQQQNRSRTVPFVNNHDTFRPQLSAQGNYTGWNLGDQLGPHIEPNDGRLSVLYAIIMAVDGAPQIFYEDLFNIGYLGNRFSHQPTVDSTLPARSDIENLMWCHQHLRFKDGAYLVRWQAPDALVIERSAKALIAVNDHWSQWQNLTGVQTNWTDGTVLVDYSGASAGTRTVYGGGLADIAIPPCNGSAPNGRRGYSVWAPQGITANYSRQPRRITQEWEMDNDLGDMDARGLQQGGSTPNNSTECRVVGRVFAALGEPIEVELYPNDSLWSLTLILLDNNCMPIDSVSGAGVLMLNHVPAYSGWYTLRIRNTTANQLGQKCWVKVTYQAPAVVQTNTPKQKCACVSGLYTSVQEVGTESLAVRVFPNPASDFVHLVMEETDWQLCQIRDMQGRLLRTEALEPARNEVRISLEGLPSGVYLVEVRRLSGSSVHKLIKQ
ncbi:MAG: T9SS type A sorting domain-containing protein [Bacteroidia bacterium]